MRRAEMKRRNMIVGLAEKKKYDCGLDWKEETWLWACLQLRNNECGFAWKEKVWLWACLKRSMIVDLLDGKKYDCGFAWKEEIWFWASLMGRSMIVGLP